MTAPLDILIVEDEALIAMDLAAIVEDCGHRVIAEAPSLRAVRALLKDQPPDLAFVDLQLAENSSGLDVCKLILEQWGQTMVVFVTANPSRLPPDMNGGHGVIAKPFSRTGVGLALDYLAQCVRTPPPTLPVPASMATGPALSKLLA